MNCIVHGVTKSQIRLSNFHFHFTLHSFLIKKSSSYQKPPAHRWSSKFNYIVLKIASAATAAAKSLQSCPTLCDPIDGSPPGSPVPGILQARTLEWVAISFSKAWKWKGKVKSLSRVRLLRPRGLQPTRLLRPWDLPGKIASSTNSHHLLLGHKSLPKVRISNNFIQKNEILRCFVTCFDHKLRGLLANVSYIPSSNPQGSSPGPLRPQCTLFSLITIHFSDCHQKNCIKYL